MTLSWLIFAGVTLVYFAVSWRDLTRTHVQEAGIVTSVLALGVGILFVRAQIEGRSPEGAANIGTTASLAVLLATRGRPSRMLDLSTSEAMSADERRRHAKDVRLYQWTFVVLGLGVGGALYFAFPGLYV